MSQNPLLCCRDAEACLNLCFIPLDSLMLLLMEQRRLSPKSRLERVALLAEKEREKAKERYVRSLWKLYSLHNQYVLALKAAEVHHSYHFQQGLPDVLQSLHSLHQEMAHIT